MSDRAHVRRLAAAVLYAMAMFVPCAASCEQEDLFPFVIGANADGAATDVSFLLRAPAGCDGFVRTEGEHFVNDRGVVRFNGVNLVGPACFPSHAEAERLAARLSRLGLNMVRLHYFDTWAYGSNFMKAPMPALFKNDPQSSCVIDEAQRDRLEYLVAQFKKRGIYLNVNLHVAQELDARDGIPKTSWANRGADFFYGPLIEKEKAYARDLLSHVNPYTGLALKDDPVVAIVEINNENGMFSTWPNGLLDGGEKFGREYQDEFRRQWQAFSGSDKDYLRAQAPGPAYTQAETNLFFRFLAHVDDAYFAGMRDFLRRELGVKVPISFTQLDYCTPHTLAESDLVDVHLYWTHPSVVNVPKGINIRRGPHRGIEWNFRAESMFACDVYEKTYDEDFVPHRATMRVKGRPFTVSETSSPYPNWYGAEFNPFLRALAAFQDWSGVVTHSWNNDLDPAPRHTTFFFSYAARTDCLAHFPAMAAMFLRGDVAPAAARVDVGEASETYFSRLAAHGLVRAGVHASPARISGGKFRSSEILVRGVGVDLSRDETQVPPLPDAVRAQMDRRIYAGPQMRLDQSDPQHPFFVVTAANTKFFSGFSSMRPFDLGDGVSVEPGTTRLGWCTISLVSLNGRGFGPGSRVLLAATGLSHNGGARFTHLEGSRWTSRDAAFGSGDTVVEGVRARIVLPGGVAACRALDGDGRPVRDVPVRSEGGKTVIDIGPEFRTVWYEIDGSEKAVSVRPVGSLSFGKPFTRGAVLQRDRPVPVWGRAEPGTDVCVSYGGLSAKGKADASGVWRVNLPALPASSVSRTLSVSTSTGTLSVDDVVVGEVWLCAGQSNMAMALVDPYTTRYRDGIGAMVAQVSDQPLVRYLETPVPTGGWRRFTPEFLSSGRRSSIAVHYALELHEKLGVPVGVVVAAAGGCNIDAYLPMVKSSSDLDAYFLSKVYPYAIRGALWYQGETNIYLGEVEEYGPKMRLLYDRWREMFENPKLSFYYVQLAPFARGNNVVHKQKDGTTRVVDYDNRFPRFLCEQAAFEKEEPNAAMTVINDLGCVGDIHPNEKWLVAKRLALHAFRRDYAFANVEDCSPEPVGATAVSNVVTVSFAHAKRMYAYQRGKRFSPDLPFELAGADGVWRPARVLNFLKGKSMADGTITNNVVVLSAAGVAAPAAVRYAWNLPWIGSLYNEVDLPLGTFERKVDR